MGNFCQCSESTNDDNLQNEKSGKSHKAIQINGKITKTNYKDFNIQLVLGRGAYGKVVLVEHIKTEKLFAMKILKKSDIKKDSQARHIADERLILEMVDHQFLVKLRYAFQTKSKLFLIVDYMNGGELFYHLRKEKRFALNLIIFYAAEMAIGIGDLKPENILLDSEGHLRLADFGLSKLCFNKDKVYTMCGTPEYIAPEVLIIDIGYDKVCDWWSYGCLVYELFVGYPPFYSKDKKQMLKNRVQKEIPYPDCIPHQAKILLQGLLQIDPKKRLGFEGLQQIKDSQFFESINWLEIEEKKEPPPYNFDCNGFSYFDKKLIHANPDSIENTQKPSNEKTIEFTNFTYEQAQLTPNSFQKLPNFGNN